MQARTTFLSKLFGWYCVLLALDMFLNKQPMVAAVSALLQEPQTVLVLGVVVLAAGLAVVISHNVWSGGAQAVIVTLLGWATFIKGLILVFLTPNALQAYFAALHYPDWFYIYAAVTLIVGIFLVVSGYRSRPA
jgi:uncharacterized membrane protein